MTTAPPNGRPLNGREPLIKREVTVGNVFNGLMVVFAMIGGAYVWTQSERDRDVKLALAADAIARLEKQALSNAVDISAMRGEMQKVQIEIAVVLRDRSVSKDGARP